MANCHRFAAGATASGTTTDVVVTTVHDETGFANLVVWSSLFDRQRRIVLSARMLRCLGHMQREGDIIYVVAVQLETRRVNAAMSATDSSRSRYHSGSWRRRHAAKSTWSSEPDADAAGRPKASGA